ncbi:MAG: bifunctional 4-hydroxy-2-oxoglutarate aldolase/2-dehydro-3-deoxy-phosphogluconate aldolase [Candidatus Omnitrophica bacterium]|nr:bifunctional 4-hydroxy-2-oxoglutarate aldolase/2-dehydro-3-deoxy-phosphogluconate aldolase [Candidatus Omnitrophota bacterium]
MDLAQFKQLPIIGILRDIELEIVDELIEAVVSSGLKTIEITMNTPNAASLIKAAQAAAKGRLMIGAGTVLSKQDSKTAQDSGATFIVSPTLVEDLVNDCCKKSIPVFPGALTPGEINKAWVCGATMVKVFPAKVFGPGYFKEIKGPFKNIELLACGGVNSKNIGEFFSSGASAVAFGASIFKKAWLKSRNFSAIEKEIKELIKGDDTIIVQ